MKCDYGLSQHLPKPSMKAHRSHPTVGKGGVKEGSKKEEKGESKAMEKKEVNEGSEY